MVQSCRCERALDNGPGFREVLPTAEVEGHNRGFREAVGGLDAFLRGHRQVIRRNGLVDCGATRDGRRFFGRWLKLR